MIHGIYANKPTFKHVQFVKGLNVVIAERQEDSDETKTVNSRGKSTLISIINFCLGSNVSSSVLRTNELMEWSFTIDITLLDKRVRATRNVNNPSRIFLDGEAENWPIMPELDKKTNSLFFSLDKWRLLLGLSLFDIPQTSNISIRSMMSYFIRSGNEAYINPLKFFASQADNVAHIYNTFFVGLDPRYAFRWSDLDKKTKTLKALGNAIKTGVHETLGELESRKVELEEELKKSRDILSNFKVHEKYKDIQIEANQLTTDLHNLTNENIFDNQRLRHYETSVAEEKTPEKTKLEKVYKEVGLIFPDNIKKTFEEANIFHEKIVNNRKSFLNAEIIRIKNNFKKREQLIKDLTIKRSECMKILDTHGALEEHSRLQEQHSKISEKLENIKIKIEQIRDNEIKIKDIKSSKLELDKKANIDYEEKRKLWQQAMKLFNETAKALYGTSGKFVIDISDKGYKFDVNIPGDHGSGIGKMEIFCYDLMVICMQRILKRNIDFLIHDSTIYEGVDERQVAHAIEQAAKKSRELSFQYIMTINSDMIPRKDFSDGFKFDEHIRLRLTDEDASSSLLGIRY